MQKKLFVVLSLLSFVGISHSAAEKTSPFEILARQEEERKAFQRALKGEQYVPRQRNDPNNNGLRFRQNLQEEQLKKEIDATAQHLIQAAAMQVVAMQNDEDITIPSNAAQILANPEK